MPRSPSISRSRAALTRSGTYVGETTLSGRSAAPARGHRARGQQVVAIPRTEECARPDHQGRGMIGQPAARPRPCWRRTRSSAPRDRSRHRAAPVPANTRSLEKVTRAMPRSAGPRQHRRPVRVLPETAFGFALGLVHPDVAGGVDDRPRPVPRQRRATDAGSAMSISARSSRRSRGRGARDAPNAAPQRSGGACDQDRRPGSAPPRRAAAGTSPSCP